MHTLLNCHQHKVNFASNLIFWVEIGWDLGRLVQKGPKLTWGYLWGQTPSLNGKGNVLIYPTFLKKYVFRQD